MNIAIINKRFSPLRSATGFHAYQLALYLRHAGHQVQFIGTLPNRAEVPKTTDGIDRVWINSSYDGKNIVRRLLADFTDAWRLIRRAKSSGVDHTIVMSDPPFLQLIATYYLVPSDTSFWFMDIYPQAFAAKGLVRKGNPIYKWYLGRLKAYSPEHVLALGEQQASYILNEFDYANNINLPIGLQELNIIDSDQHPSWYEGDHLIYLLYKGNLGSAHDDQFLVTLSNHLDPSKHRLIVNVSGAKSEQFLKRIGNNISVHIVAKMTEPDLTFADIHIVTLLNEWTHICVPSKALFALSVGSAVLYHGSDQSDTWGYVDSIGWRISNDYASNSEIKSFLAELSIEEIKKREVLSVQLYQALSSQLKESYANYESKLR